jgi:hypothetical protein
VFDKRLPNDLGQIRAALEPHREELVGVVIESTYYRRPGIMHGLWGAKCYSGCDWRLKQAATVLLPSIGRELGQVA